MSDTIDYTEVPYLQEILNFLPINPDDAEDVNNYINNITNLIAINYKYEQYQFAYFGVHLLYMTYLYSTVWKLSQIEPQRYKDAIIYIRSYAGRESDLKIEDAESIFAFSLIPEKDIAKIFKLFGLDKSHINIVGNIVDVRNDMAHASGKFDILTDDAYDAKVNSIMNSIKNIHRNFDATIRKWFSTILLNFCNGEYSEYNNVDDIIDEQMIHNFKLSVKELLICNEMSVKGMITEHREYESKLKKFKKALRTYCLSEEYLPS